MPYAIARIEKLKESNLAGSWSHVARTRNTPNANTTIANRRLIGEPNAALRPLVMEKIELAAKKRKIREDAVYCVEMLLTTSPDYFRTDDPSDYGEWDEKRLEDWVQANVDWLKQEYGDRVVLSELHMDEATPHIHAFVVPLDERGHLNCKAFFGGRENLRAFQDRYHAAVKHLGLERGIQGSRAKHQDIKDFYQIVDQSRDLTAQLSLEVLRAKAADRDRAMVKREEMEKTAKGQQREIQQLQEEMQHLEAELSRYRAELGVWKRKYQDLADGLRGIPLENVAHELGLNLDPVEGNKWKDETHVITINGPKFYDFLNSQGGGGAIDLVMYVEQCSYKQAVVWLHDHFGEGVLLQVASEQTRAIVEEVPAQPFEPPAKDEEKWQLVRQYLTDARKISGKLVDLMYDHGLLYADSKQNAVFIRRSWDGQVETGASLRGTAGENNRFIGLAKGSKRHEGWFYLKAGTGDEVDRVVLVESPIEAISCWCLNRERDNKRGGRTVYLATDGISAQLINTIQEIPTVVAAFNNNSSGEQLAQQVTRAIPNVIRCVPNGKDWNEDLVATSPESSEKRQSQQHRRSTSNKKRDIDNER